MSLHGRWDPQNLQDWLVFLLAVIGGGILHSLIYKGEFMKIVRTIRTRLAQRRTNAKKDDPPNP